MILRHKCLYGSLTCALDQQILTLTYQPLATTFSLTMGRLLNGWTCMDPSFSHFSDCVVASGLRFLPTGTTIPFILLPWNSTFDIHCETKCWGGAFRYNRVFYHIIAAEVNSMFCINPFLIRWHLAPPPWSNFLPFHLVPPIMQSLLTTGAARHGGRRTTSWK